MSVATLLSDPIESRPLVSVFQKILRRILRCFSNKSAVKWSEQSTEFLLIRSETSSKTRLILSFLMFGSEGRQCKECFSTAWDCTATCCLQSHIYHLVSVDLRLPEEVELFRTNNGLMNNYQKTNKKNPAVNHPGNNTVLRIKRMQTFEQGHFYKFNHNFLLWAMLMYFMWNILFRKNNMHFVWSHLFGKLIKLTLYVRFWPQL